MKFYSKKLINSRKEKHITVNERWNKQCCILIKLAMKKPRNNTWKE